MNGINDVSFVIQRQSGRPVGDLGAHRVKFIEGCPETSFCRISGVTVLSDGKIVLGDSENYKLKMFDINGKYLGSHSTVPLSPFKISRSHDYKVLAKVETLDGGYGILEMDMRDGSSKLIIELGRFDWEFSCSSSFGILGDSIFVGCSPYLFKYHKNGTLLNKIEAKGHKAWIQIFETELGSHQTLLGGPVFETGIHGSFAINTAVDEQLNVICTFRRNSLRGAVGKDGSIYAIDYYTRNKVFKFSKTCEELGLLVTAPWTIEYLAVFNNLLVVSGHKRNRYNLSGDRVLVYELP